MFLSVLSGAVIALALVAQITSFGDDFALFALLLLPVVLFVGVATYARLVQINTQDARLTVGMNRLRHAYLELRPDLRRYFVTGSYDDFRGFAATFFLDAPEPTGLVAGVLGALVSESGMLAVIDGVVAGVLVALLALELGSALAVALGAALIAFATIVGLLTYIQARALAGLRFTIRPEFPSPEEVEPASEGVEIT